ncbi:hypothetical protein AAVH_18213 [Aphelenchoides avenae]|nr:hypothetical protein AAVH_18213 [Aphelenchus avenae]
MTAISANALIFFPDIIIFPDAFTKTATGQRFLIYDSRQHEPGESLKLRDNWSADGTFWCTPRLFDSLYTIHANIGSSSVPAAYMLLQNRRGETYTRALRALVRYGNLQGVAPTTFMHDFELAAILAIKAVFPDSMIRLCLFHFAQAPWRNIQEHGLAVLYKAVKKARVLLRRFGALATLPVEHVSKGLEAIVQELRTMLYETGEIPMEHDAGLIRFEDYFEKTYVRRLVAPGQFGEPRFRPMLWNCFQAIIQELHRTNNAVEGWHREFNNTFTSARPALDKFILQMQNDEDKNRQRLVRHEALPANPLRRRRLPAYMASDRHIVAIARMYHTDYAPQTDAADDYGQLLRYLKCMQNHLQHPPVPGGNDDEGGDDVEDDDIPLDESHPGIDESSDEDEQQGDNDAVVAAQPALRAHVQQPVLQNDAAAQAEEDGALPGGSQLAPVGIMAANVGVRRQQPKRAAVSQGGPSAFRLRYSN